MKYKKDKYLKILLSSMLTCSSVFSIVNIRATSDNIALNKNVTAISSDGSHLAENVTDGDLNTFWESMGDYNRWVEIDLDGIYNLTGIEVHTPIGYVSNYTIYVSEDNDNYVKVISKIDDVIEDKDGTYFNVNEKACKVRVNITYSSLADNNKGNNSQVGYINEVKVYGSKIEGSDTPKEPEISVKNFEESEYGIRYEEMEKDIDLKNQSTIQEVYNLIGRVAGEKYKNKFVLELVPSTTSKDKFIISMVENKIKISGPNGISLASGFNYYLKNYVHVNYDPIEGGAVVVVPESLPGVDTTIVKETPYDYKYLNNFCTPSYTYAFWNWDEYEPYLDWCAMNGINLMLDFIGQEEVQRRMLKKFGYTDEEIKQYIPGPAYYGWFYMGNMSSFGGPLPNEWFEQRTELGRKVHERMYLFGIDPVFVGYAGQVPEDFKEKNSDAEVIEQGYWPGGNAFVRPPVLKTYIEGNEVDYFDKAANEFYKASKEVFGDITPYFAIDPFHEGGKKTWVDENGVTHRLDETKISNTVQKKMLEYRDDAIWIVQNWQNNPTKAFLDGVDKSHTIVLDLYADNQPHYQPTLTGSPKPDYMVNDYDGTPWIWGMLHSFGGRMGFSGMPEILTEEMPNQLDSKYMKGIGVTAESMATNPMLYELIFDMGWENAPIDLDKYISNYFLSRYGVQSDNIEDAWDIMLETAYHKRYDRQRAEDSIINAQPNLNATSASGYITAIIDYDKEKFEQILELYLKEYNNLKTSEAYLYDLADITRQVLQNSSYEYLQEAKKAWNDKDAEAFKKYSDIFLEIILLQDKVLSTTNEFSLGHWIEMSRTILDDMDDWTEDLFELNARLQVTSWGSGPANGMLKDYSNRQWSGLTGDYYYGRWSQYFQKLNESAQNGSWSTNHGINWFAYTYRWANLKGNVDSEGNPYTTIKDESLNISDLANKALEKYSVINIEKEPDKKKENIALGMPVIVSGNLNSKYPGNNVTDGDSNTLWMNNDFNNASLTVNFTKAVSVNGIEIEFKTPEEDRRDAPTYAYKVDVMDDKGDWITVDDKTGDISQKDTIIPISYDGYLKQVKVTILDADMSQYDFKPCLAEVRVFKGGEEEIAEAENIALNKEVIAQRSAPNPSRTPNKAVDGDKNTFWSSGSAQDSWIMVNLGELEAIDAVGLIFEKGKTPMFGYKIELLNANQEPLKTLDKLSDTSVKNNSLQEIISGKAQFVRITLHKDNQETAFPALAEIEVYQKTNGIEQDYNVGQKYGVGYSAQSSVNKAANVIDGNVDTRWGSGSAAFPQYLELNVGTSISMNSVELVFPDNLMNRLNWQIEFYDVLGNKINQINKETLIKDAELIKGTEGTNNAYHRIKFDYDNNAAKIRYTVTGVANEGDSAWAGLAEFNVIHESKDLLREIQRNIEVNGADNTLVTNIYDNSSETSLLFSGDNKNIIIDFGGQIDINKMTILHQNEKPLLYKIYSSNNNQNYKLIADRSDGTEYNNTLLEMFGSKLTGQYIKIEFINEEDVSVDELYIYRKDYSKEFKELVETYSKEFAKFERGFGAGQVPNDIYDEEIGKFNIGVSNEENYSSLFKLNEFKSSLQVSVEKLSDNKIYPISSDLLIEITKAENLIKYLDKNEINNEEKKVLKNYIDNARLVYNKYKVTQKELDQAKKELEKAYSNLIQVLAVDKTALKTAIEMAKNADLENVVPAVVKEFNEALTYAKDVFDNVSATQDEVDNAFNRLANVMQMLEFFKGDKTVLQKMVDQIADLTASDYIESTWNAMLPVLDKANEVLGNENAMQEEVDEAYTELVKAFLDLRLKPNKDLLNDLINKANGLKEAKYTEASWKVMNEALNDAKAVLDNPEATEKEVANAKFALTKALARLEVNTNNPVVDNKPVETVKPGDTTVSIKTGDETSLGMLMSLAGLSVLGMVYSKKKRENI